MLTSYICIVAFLHKYIDEFTNIYIYIYSVGKRNPGEVIAEDLKKMGHIFQFNKLDASMFLLPQRRTRVWGTSDLASEVSQSEYSKLMQDTILSMAGDERFEFTDVFDITLPKVSLTNQLQQSKLKQALEQGKLKGYDMTTPNCFMDCATCKQRSTESAWNMTTCVRPSHKIYSTKLERFLHVKELWNCQGLFPSAFPNPKAVEEFIKNKSTNAQDLAGRDVAPKVVVVKSMVLCI